MANSVAAEPGKAVTLCLSFAGAVLRIEVPDASPEPVAVRETAPGEPTEDGRGLS